jgi:hypothetical protein
MSNRRFTSFKDFWPFYVAEHSKPGTRWFHLIGTVIGTGVMLYFIVSGRWWFIPLGLIPGYGAAWFAHFVIEKNRPATFQYPLWSFMGDYKMIAMMLTGRIAKEVQKRG